MKGLEEIRLVFMITPFCNLKCEYCYYADYNNKAKLNYKIFTIIIDKLYNKLFQDKNTSVDIIIRGGELAIDMDTLKYFKYIISKLESLPNDWEVNTNTNMLGLDTWYKEYKKLMEQYPKNIFIRASIHPSEKEDSILKNYKKYSLTFPKPNISIFQVNYDILPKLKNIMDVGDISISNDSHIDIMLEKQYYSNFSISYDGTILNNNTGSKTNFLSLKL